MPERDDLPYSASPIRSARLTVMCSLAKAMTKYSTFLVSDEIKFFYLKMGFKKWAGFVIHLK